MLQSNGTAEICPPSAPFCVPPDSKRHKALTRLRAWERHRKRWQQLRRECFSGARYADLLEQGRARPYELGVVRYVLLDVLSADAVALLEHLLACERGFGGKHGVVASHAHTARWLRCCERTAGDAMRELVALGLVEQRPEYLVRSLAARSRTHAIELVQGKTAGKHQEIEPAYETTTRCHAVIAREAERRGRRSQGGKICLPSIRRTSTPSGSTKGVRGRGRPERQFAESVRAGRRPKLTAAGKAVVIERLAGGGVAIASLLSADVVAERLRRAGGTTTPQTRDERRAADTWEHANALAWAAFEAAQRSKGGAGNA